MHNLNAKYGLQMYVTNLIFYPAKKNEVQYRLLYINRREFNTQLRSTKGINIFLFIIILVDRESKIDLYESNSNWSWNKLRKSSKKDKVLKKIMHLRMVRQLL